MLYCLVGYGLFGMICVFEKNINSVMKNILTLIISLLLVLGTYAQEVEMQKKKLHFAFEMGPKVFSSYTYDGVKYESFNHGVVSAPIEWTLYLGYRINDQHEVSLGQTMFDGFFQGKYCLPTLLDYRYYFSSEMNTYYTYAGVGFTFIGDPSIKCANFKFGVGYRFNLYKKTNLNFSIGYDFTPMYDHFFDKDRTIKALNFKLGVGF